mgnify:CR=1 FL=1
MDTGKSISESNGGFYEKQSNEPNYLSGKIIDGLNGKLFNKAVYNSDHSKNHETDLGSENK